MDNMQSVFSNATDLEREFDNMFEAEQEDNMLALIQGLDESGSELPDFETLHQMNNTGTTNDMAKSLGPNHDVNKPTADSNGDFDIEDDFDIADPKTGVADAVTKSAPDEENLTKETDKATSAMEKQYNEAFESLMEEFGLDEPDQGLDNDSDQQDQLEDNEGNPQDMRNPVKDEACSKEGCSSSKEEGCKKEGCGSTDEACKKEACNKEGCGSSKKEGCGSTDEACKKEGCCKREESDSNYTDDVEEEIDDNYTDDVEDEIEDDDEKDDECEGGECDDNYDEGYNFSEASSDLTSDIEDEIIDDIESEDDTPASDSEVKALEDVDDDDIIDDILAEG